jgi:hypothetical protein
MDSRQPLNRAGPPSGAGMARTKSGLEAAASRPPHDPDIRYLWHAAVGDDVDPCDTSIGPLVTTGGV